MWGDNARSRTQFREPLAKAVAPRDGTKSRLRAWAMPLGAAPTKTPAGGRSRGPISVQGGAYGRPQQETPSRKSAMTETNTTSAGTKSAGIQSLATILWPAAMGPKHYHPILAQSERVIAPVLASTRSLVSVPRQFVRPSSYGQLDRGCEPHRRVIFSRKLD